MPPGAVRTGNAGRPSVLPRPIGPGIFGEAKSQQCFPHGAVFGTGLAASTSVQASRVLPGQITAPWCPGARVAVPSAVHRIYLLNGWENKTKKRRILSCPYTLSAPFLFRLVSHTNSDHGEAETEA
ncbi:hypothetical protein TcCL_NonESM06722 [Trypanosoma cruzi]|nr:hypothetical protein TcCL_NonESM06722 [Trypanosoma cruzi]